MLCAERDHPRAAPVGEDVARLALFALRSTQATKGRSYLTAQWIEAAASALADRPDWQDRDVIRARMRGVNLVEAELHIRQARAKDPTLSGSALAWASIFTALGGELEEEVA